MIRRLADRYDRLQVCFEAGSMGYGLYRQVEALGHDCMVVAPALIPKCSGGAHQDEPARRGHAGATATARRADTQPCFRRIADRLATPPAFERAGTINVK